MLKTRNFKHKMWKIQVLLILVFLIILMCHKSMYHFFCINFALLLVILFLICTWGKKGLVLAILLCIYYYRNIQIIFTILHTVKTIPKENKDEYTQKRVYNLFNTHFRLHHNFHKIPSYPCIIVANYIRDRVENILYPILPCPTTILAREGSYLNYLNGNVLEHTIPTYTGCYNDIREKIKDTIAEGRNIFCYVSAYNKGVYNGLHISKIHTSMFRIAKELNIPILPISFDYIEIEYGRVIDQPIYIRVGDNFMVNNIDEDVKKTKKFFQNSLNRFKQLKKLI